MKVLFLIVIIVMATIGLVSTMAQPIDAWHSKFDRLDHCLDWYTNFEDMTTPQAHDECQENLEH